jgi:hypothetical protein
LRTMQGQSHGPKAGVSAASPLSASLTSRSTSAQLPHPRPSGSVIQSLQGFPGSGPLGRPRGLRQGTAGNALASSSTTFHGKGFRQLLRRCVYRLGMPRQYPPIAFWVLHGRWRNDVSVI